MTNCIVSSSKTESLPRRRFLNPRTFTTAPSIGMPFRESTLPDQTATGASGASPADAIRTVTTFAPSSLRDAAPSDSNATATAFGRGAASGERLTLGETEAHRVAVVR